MIPTPEILIDFYLAGTQVYGFFKALEEIQLWGWMNCSVTVFNIFPPYIGPSLVAQTVKRLPAVRETWIQSLGRNNPLEEEIATHSSTLAWKIPWMEEPGGLQSMGSQRVKHD